MLFKNAQGDLASLHAPGSSSPAQLPPLQVRGPADTWVPGSPSPPYSLPWSGPRAGAQSHPIPRVLLARETPLVLFAIHAGALVRTSAFPISYCLPDLENDQVC